jgi:hypothetical protein
MIPYTKSDYSLFWNNLRTIVSARGGYSPFQIVYALRRQSPLSNCVRSVHNLDYSLWNHYVKDHCAAEPLNILSKQ